MGMPSAHVVPELIVGAWAMPVAVWSAASFERKALLGRVESLAVIISSDTAET